MRKLILFLFVASSLFASVGKIVTLRGDVVIVSADKERAAIENDVLEENDKIITKNNAKLQIKFIDDTVVTLGKNTTLDVKQYIIDGKNSKVSLAVDNGDFKVISGKISQIARENFEFQAKTATIGIRGTVFVGNLNEKTSKIGCLQGAIDVKIGNKSSLINAGHQMQFSDNKILKIEKIVPKDYESVSGDKIANNTKVDVSKNDNFSDMLSNKEAIINANKAKGMEYKNANIEKYQNNYNNYNNKGEYYKGDKINNVIANKNMGDIKEKIYSQCGGNAQCIANKTQALENKCKYNPNIPICNGGKVINIGGGNRGPNQGGNIGGNQGGSNIGGGQVGGSAGGRP